MWICSKYGFYSVVQKQGQVQIRARVRRDLENLLQATASRLQIIETPKADYRFRIICSRRQWKAIGAHLVDIVDYPNFKSHIAQTADQANKHYAYGIFWKSMYMLQQAIVVLQEANLAK